MPQRDIAELMSYTKQQLVNIDGPRGLEARFTMKQNGDNKTSRPQYDALVGGKNDRIRWLASAGRNIFLQSGNLVIGGSAAQMQTGPPQAR